jgi:hypothetical protein
LAALYAVREPLYKTVASVTVDVDELPPETVVERVLAGTGFGARAAGTGRDEGRGS